MHIPRHWSIGRVTVAILMACGACAATAQTGRPFMTTADGAMSARIDGPRCGDVVRMTFVAAEQEPFRAGQNTAARLMNNVTVLLRQQCPSMVRVAARGMVEARLVYSGIAEAATNWEVVELGSGTNLSLLSGSAAKGGVSSGPSARDLFGRDANFLPAPKLLQWVRETPTLCVKPDPAAGNCNGLNEFQAQSDGTVRMTASYRLDATGATAVLGYPATNKAGFFCSNPQDAKVTVNGGSMTTGGRADMQAMLLERVQAAGDEVCSGYQGTSPQALLTENFGSNGASQAQKAPAALVAKRPPLRLDR